LTIFRAESREKTLHSVHAQPGNVDFLAHADHVAHLDHKVQLDILVLKDPQVQLDHPELLYVNQI